MKQSNAKTRSVKKRNLQTKFKDGWLLELDNRTSISKEMKERYNVLTDDLGGVSNLSYQQRSLVERALWLEYWLATQERELSMGRKFDVARWTQAANALQGIFAKLGLNRVRTEKSLNDIINNSVSASK